MLNRNRNIFIRKETEHSINYYGGFPVFALVLGYHPNSDDIEGNNGNVHYIVDYLEVDQTNELRLYSSGTYIKPLSEFLKRFSPDIWNFYDQVFC